MNVIVAFTMPLSGLCKVCCTEECLRTNQITPMPPCYSETIDPKIHIYDEAITIWSFHMLTQQPPCSISMSVSPSQRGPLPLSLSLTKQAFTSYIETNMVVPPDNGS